MTVKRKMTGPLACVMIAATLSACAGSGEAPKQEPAKGTDSPAASGAPASASPAGSQLPIVKDGSVTLSLASYDNWYTPKSYSLNLPVWQEVEKRTGIKIKWEVSPAAQYGSAMQVRMAAAKDLPDLINLPGDPVKYGADGVIILLNDLIDKHAPNIKKFMADNPDIRKLMTAPDGKIYGLTSVTYGASSTDPYGLLIRKDWLDKLGLKEPTTLDEWYTVLKAFKEKDPNGNGKADEIPLSPHYTWQGLALFGNALGLHLSFYSFAYSVDSSGKVQYDWLNPKAKELVVWLNKLYKEGLLDPEFMTKGEDKILADVSRELVGSTNHFLNATAKYNSAIGKSADWTMALPPGNGADKGYYEKYGPTSGFYSISKDSKHPVEAIKWLDYVYASEEGARLVASGIEGLSYKMVNGKLEFTDFVAKNPDGLDPANALRSIGAFPITPWIRSDKGVYAEQPKALLQLNPAMVEKAKRVEPYLRSGAILDYILASPDELDELSRLTGDIPTYLDETIVKFITGREPIDWDKFTEKLKSLGIEKQLAVKQKQYDRFIKQ